MMSVTEAVIKERNLNVIERTRTEKEIEHFGTDRFICGVNAECAYRKCRSFKRSIHSRFRKCLQLGKALGKRRKGKGLFC